MAIAVSPGQYFLPLSHALRVYVSCLIALTALTSVSQAVGQICSTASMTHNLEQCVRLMEEAAGKEAKVRFCFLRLCGVNYHTGGWDLSLSGEVEREIAGWSGLE